MKNVLFLIALALGAAATAQTTRTVCNNCPAQFSSLQLALDASANGDIILVSGSAISYESITIGRRVTLIGAGSKSTNQFNLESKLGTVTLAVKATDVLINASGTSITGFDIGTIRTEGTTSSNYMSNIVLTRNEIDNIVFGNNFFTSNWIIQNNIIGHIAYGADDPTNNSNSRNGFRRNYIIANNVITQSIGYGFDALRSSNILITNNLFAGQRDASYLYGMESVVFSNNIFLKTTAAVPICENVKQCTFNNNILARTAYNIHTAGDGARATPTTGGFLGNSNTGGNNLYGDPGFTNFPTADWSTGKWSVADVSLATSSIGKNAGTDGTDIGILGGATPMPTHGGAPASGYFLYPPPAVPQVESVDILNSTLGGTQNLNVIIKAKSSN